MCPQAASSIIQFKFQTQSEKVSKMQFLPFFLCLSFPLAMATKSADQQAQPFNASASGQAESEPSKGVQIDGKQFIPLLRNGHLVSAKFEAPNGPLQATLNFDGSNKAEKATNTEVNQKQPPQGPPGPAKQFATRAILSGRDASGAAVRKSFNAKLANADEKKKQANGKENSIRDGDSDGTAQGKEVPIHDGDTDGTANLLELGGGPVPIEGGFGRKRAELAERQPAALVVQPKKIDKKKKEQPKNDHLTEVIGTAKEAPAKAEANGSVKVEDPSKKEKEEKNEQQKGEEAKKNEEKPNGVEEAKRSEEFNTLSFLPAFLGRNDAANGGVPAPKNEANQQQQNTESIQAKPSGGSVQLAPVAREERVEEPANCEDQAENCAENSAFCNVSPYEKLMAENCAQTCQHCATKRERESVLADKVGTKKEGEEVKPPVEGEKTEIASTREEQEEQPCNDLSIRCAQWSQRGFCTSRFFHRDLKARFCAKSCALCGELAKAGRGE